MVLSCHAVETEGGVGLLTSRKKQGVKDSEGSEVRPGSRAGQDKLTY
jgi:hypothetical protein